MSDTGYTGRAMTSKKHADTMKSVGWRNRGYQDGLVGRERASRDPDYLAGYRRGAQARTAPTSSADQLP